MSNSERILIKIPFDRSKGDSAPSFEQFGVFYKEFGKLLTKEERQNSQVYFEDGSIKMRLLLAVSQIALFDFAPTLIEALNNPQTVQHKIISALTN